MKPAALCFDATGTLITTAEPVGEVYHRVALEHGVDLPAWRLEDAFRRVLRHAPARGLEGDSAEARRESEVQWWFERIRQTFQATDSTARFEDFAAFATSLFDFYRRSEAWQIRPGVRDLLAAPSLLEVPLAVVSNFDHRLIEILQSLDIYRFFRSIIIPSACGAAKPDRRIFEAAAHALKQPIERLGYVGDDAPETLAAIARLGVRVFNARAIRSWDSFPALLATPATLRPAAD